MGIPELDIRGKGLLAEHPITIPPETVATGPAVLQSKITANRTLQMAIAGLPYYSQLDTMFTTKLAKSTEFTDRRQYTL
jgi:hypothetical protein